MHLRRTRDRRVSLFTGGLCPWRLIAMTDPDFERRAEDALARWDLLMENWRGRAHRNKRFAKFFAYSSVSLSAITTFLTAISGSPRWALAAVSSLTTLAAALLSATRAQEQWVTARSIQNHLYRERFLFEQIAGPYGDADLDQQARLKLFAERLSDLAIESHQTWASTVRDHTRQNSN